MPFLNLYQLLSGDDQQTHTDKINFNFDQILSMGGGPIGLQGIQGTQGIPGQQGLQGDTGPQGDPGARWTVEAGAPTGPYSPAPNVGDFWFDTDTLIIYEYDGSTWNATGTLVVQSVFTQGTNNILFTDPQQDRSLVLSHLDYSDAGNLNNPDSDGSGAYRLKIVGESGISLVQLAIADPTGTNGALVEIDESEQARIFIETNATNALDHSYKLTIENPSDDIYISGSGTNLRLTKSTGGISTFAFNATTAQLSLSSNLRAMTFSSSTSGLIKYTIGRHGATSTVADRLFTVSDSGYVGINQAFDDNAGVYYKLDQLERTSLSTTLGSRSRLFRIQQFTTTNPPVNSLPTDTYDELKVDFIRAIAGGTYLGSELRIARGLNSTSTGVVGTSHFVSFHGGAKTSTDEQLTWTAGGSRPQLRFGYGQSVNNGYYYGSDVNGYSIFGESTAIKNYNEDTTTYSPNRARQLPTRMNIYWNSGSNPILDPKKDTYGGLHFLSPGSVGLYTGITHGGAITAATGSNPLNELNTNAGLLFENETDGVSLNLMTGKYTDGMSKRMSIYSLGTVHYWGYTNKRHYLEVDVNDKYTIIASGEYPNGQMRNIVLAPDTTARTDQNTLDYDGTSAGGPQSGNLAVAVVVGGIVSSVFLVGGVTQKTFQSVPTVELIGGLGGDDGTPGYSKATVTATLLGGTSGILTGFVITDPGQGYVVPPVVVITGGTTSGLRAPETGQVGGGFIGIGDFSNDFESNSFVLEQPQTKFHVNGATTFGQRTIFDSYEGVVGFNSLFHGNTGHATGQYSAIIGGGGLNEISGSARHTVALGYNGNANTTANKVRLLDPYKVVSLTHTSISPNATSTNGPTYAVNGLTHTPGGGASAYINPNALTIDIVDGQSNGLEVFLQGTTSATFAPILVSSPANTVAYPNGNDNNSTLFVVNKQGKVGAHGDVIPTAGTTASAPVNAHFTIAPTTPAISSNGDLVLTQEVVGAFGFRSIRLSDYKVQTSIANGGHLIMSPGGIYNDGPGGSGSSTANGGNLYLVGGVASALNGGASNGGSVYILGGLGQGGTTSIGKIYIGTNGSPVGDTVLGSTNVNVTNSIAIGTSAAPQANLHVVGTAKMLNSEGAAQLAIAQSGQTTFPQTSYDRFIHVSHTNSATVELVFTNGSERVGYIVGAGSMMVAVPGGTTLAANVSNYSGSFTIDYTSVKIGL